MQQTGEYTVVARLRPKPHAEQRLLAIRDQFMDEIRKEVPGFVSATLYRVDGTDEWRDVFVFADATAAAGIETAEIPTYSEWASLVDVVSDEILEHIAHHHA